MESELAPLARDTSPIGDVGLLIDSDDRNTINNGINTANRTDNIENNNGGSVSLFLKAGPGGLLLYTLVVVIVTCLGMWSFCRNDGSGHAPGQGGLLSHNATNTTSPQDGGIDINGEDVCNTLVNTASIPSQCLVKDPKSVAVYARDVFLFKERLWFPRMSVSNTDMATLDREFKEMGLSIRTGWYTKSMEELKKVQAGCSKEVDFALWAATVPTTYYTNIFHFSHDVVYNLYQSFLGCAECSNDKLDITKATYIHSASVRGIMPAYQMALVKLLTGRGPVFTAEHDCIHFKSLLLGTRTFPSLYHGVQSLSHNVILERYKSFLDHRVTSVYNSPPPAASPSLQVAIIDRPSGSARAFKDIKTSIASLSQVPILASVDMNVKVTDLSGMDFKDQVRVFQNADIVIAAHGAALTSAWYVRPGTVVVQVLNELQCPWLGSYEYGGITHAARGIPIEYCIKQGHWEPFSNHGAQHVFPNTPQIERSFTDFSDDYQLGIQTQYTNIATKLILTTKELAHIIHTARQTRLARQWEERRRVRPPSQVNQAF